MGKKFKSNFNDPVYSNTYNNSGKNYKIQNLDGLSEDEFDENIDEWVEGYKQWQKDLEKYNNKMKNNLINPEGKDINKKCCDEPLKHLNIISNSLKFYVCKNCGADLGDF